MTSKQLILPLSLASAMLLAGCAVKNDRTELGFVGLSYHSDITKLSNGDYVASVEASPGRGRISGASASVIQDATKYCQSMDKAMKVIKEEQDSHLLVNGVSRLTFRCE